MSNSTAKRIVAIDLMRTFAVLMMIQGHTVHSLLSKSYANSDSVIYYIWHSFRAFTAPLFIFASGFIFTFLLYQNGKALKHNPRVIKGIKRGVSLIMVGYLLRYPTIKIFNLPHINYSQWKTFFTVDALHLIGVGLLLILLFAFILEKIKCNPIIFFMALTFIIFVSSPSVNSRGWSDSVNIFLVSYITFQYGSIFPLFPYLQFIFLGAVFGVILANDKKIIVSTKNLLTVAVIGTAILSFSALLDTVYSNSLLRIGVVLILFSLFGVIGKNKASLPNSIQSLAKNSLWIYIIHLVILYGSPISIGLHQIIGKRLSLTTTLLIAISMIILMTIISLRIDKFKITKFNIFRKKLSLE